MQTEGSKKMLNMYILKILQEYTDEKHRLTQQEIIKLLKLNYGVECDRRSIKNNIDRLSDELNYDIDCENGIYLRTREFEDAELRMLIDCVLFSKNLSKKQAETLINKLRAKGNYYFQNKISHIHNLPYLHHTDNKQILYTLNEINDAISEKKKISFTYNTYGTDFKLHPKRKKKYIVNPFQMAENNGYYYLIGNYDAYDNISHYRVDKMTDVEKLEENRKKPDLIPEIRNQFNLPKHMTEHIYMFSGPSIPIKIKTIPSIMDELIDWFGKDFRIYEKNEDSLIIRVNCNEQAMFYWAMQYGTCAEVLEPPSLREKIADAVCEMSKKYT